MTPAGALMNRAKTDAAGGLLAIQKGASHEHHCKVRDAGGQGLPDLDASFPVQSTSTTLINHLRPYRNITRTMLVPRLVLGPPVQLITVIIKAIPS